MRIAILSITIAIAVLVACTNNAAQTDVRGSGSLRAQTVGNPKLIAQVPLWQIERFPKEPAPWAQLDWAQRARDFDNYAFN